MLVRVSPLMIVALLGCAGDKASGECGESFCLPPDSSLSGRETPAEDFTLYRVERKGQSFLIYEGNHPERGDVARTDARLPIDPIASLAMQHGRGSVVVRMRQREWPNFLEISGPCQSTDACPVLDLARAISRR
jgi:hypothetical protein